MVTAAPAEANAVPQAPYVPETTLAEAVLPVDRSIDGVPYAMAARRRSWPHLA